MTPSDPFRPTDPLAALAHELKTPLAAIIGFADVMRARVFGPLDGKYAECADTIHEAARHMLALIDDLPRLAGAAIGAVERFDARGPIVEVVRLISLKAQSAGVSLSTDLPHDPVVIDADPSALRQIAINLATNALEATPRGGRVSVALARAGHELILSVEDTGPGAGGASEGLGLRLVRALVAQHGGDFTLGGSLDGGARALVRLPVMAPD